MFDKNKKVAHRRIGDLVPRKKNSPRKTAFVTTVILTVGAAIVAAIAKNQDKQ